MNSPTASVRRPPIVVIALLFLASACGSETGATSEVEAVRGGDGGAWWEGDGRGPGATNDPPQQAGPRDEVCDGLDNDLDGETDEDTGDGQPCTSENGLAGTWRCVAGDRVCQDCRPGDVRTRSCGCGGDTEDACNNAGRWVIGACGCPDLTDDSCALDPECQPGEERVRRCDACVAGQDCGSSCMGALFRCTSACTWQQVGGCEVRPPSCDRDLVRVEECGKCGRREVTCDGCFFVESPCSDQGACRPGDSQAVSCFDNACVEGYAASVRCNEQCSWEPRSCEGCAIGPPRDVDILCVDGHAECGRRVVRSHCELQRTVTSCEGTALAIGQDSTETVLDECANVVAAGFCTPSEVTTQLLSCGPNACGRSRTLTRTCLANGCGATEVVSGSCPTCSEGQTYQRACTTATGGCGSQSVTCDSTCEWGDVSECVQVPDTCVAGSEIVDEISCGPNACGRTITRIRTCPGNGCGWSETTVGSCGSCTDGQNDSRACTTAAGACGLQSRGCAAGCEWGAWSDCTPIAGLCTPGERQTRSCTAACNKPGTALWECSGGCGEWTQVGACESALVQCNPGTTETIGPCPLCPSVPQTRTCDAATCDWVMSTCPICL